MTQSSISVDPSNKGRMTVRVRMHAGFAQGTDLLRYLDETQPFQDSVPTRQRYDRT